MSDKTDNTVPRDLATGLPLDRDQLLDGNELEEKVASGVISRQEADEILQAAARRHTAEQGPDLDTDEEGRITQGGFGSGQGMSSHSGATGRQSSGDND
jgi:hypothetical protein